MKKQAGKNGPTMEQFLRKVPQNTITGPFNPILGGGGAILHFQFYTSKIFFESL